MGNVLNTELVGDFDRQRRALADGAVEQDAAVPQEEERTPAGREEEEGVVSFETVAPSTGPVPVEAASLEEIQASAKAKRPQGELALDGGPKGKFDGEEPNMLEGEDLDIPPFLRNKR